MSQNIRQSHPSPSANTYNEIFDRVVAGDRTIPVVEYKGDLPKPRRQPESTSLVFDPELISISFTVREKLNDRRYTDQAKIQFLKGVIAWKKKDILTSIEREPCQYMVTNPEALQLVKDYFLKQPAPKNKTFL
jgi:hypothetical protein